MSSKGIFIGGSMRILLTGVAGFIGMHLVEKLLSEGHTILGIDNFEGDNFEGDYYDLKQWRLHRLDSYDDFLYLFNDVCNKERIESAFRSFRPDIVFHLAAKANVRDSFRNPQGYIRVNEIGFANIIQLAQKYNVQRFIYASSSSVYGESDCPNQETDRIENILSPYAVTKRANELLAKTYTENFGLQTIGLRFFTVYGPAGRPDMAIWKFTEQISQREPITLYNHGKMTRDFVYIDDIVHALYQVMITNDLPQYFLVNVGTNESIGLHQLVNCISTHVGKPVTKQFAGMQRGDVLQTQAGLARAGYWLQYHPTIFIDEGISRFVSWYQKYYQEEIRAD